MASSDETVYSAPPPDGVIPNWNNPYSADGLIAVIGIFVPLALIAMGIRIYTRARIVGNLAMDDYLMLFAMVTSVALTACILDLLNYGLGKHMYDIPITTLFPNFLKVNVVAAILFCASTGFAKTSILLFYQRIFPARIFRWTILGLVAFTGFYSAASVFVNIFSCTPVAKSWDLAYLDTGSCINRPVFYFAQAGLGIVTDFATVLAPLPMMWNLRLPFRQKVGVALLLTMGAFVCIVSIIRLQSLYVLLKGVDLTIDTVNALLWCVVELNLSIIGGCVPAVRPFIRKYFPALLGGSDMYATEEGQHASASRSRSHSHQLRSFDPVPANKAGFAHTTIRGAGDTKGDHESQEFIIQGSPGEDPHPGKITKTVEFGISRR